MAESPATINLGYGQDKPYGLFKTMVLVLTYKLLARELQGLTFDELKLWIVVAGPGGKDWTLYLEFCGLQFKYRGGTSTFGLWKEKGFYNRRDFLVAVADEIAMIYANSVLEKDWSVDNLPRGT